MPRPKKPEYEYVERLGQYRKRIKDIDGKYVAIYAKDPDTLTEKVKNALQQIELQQTVKLNPTVAQYASEWLALNTASITKTAKNDYANSIKNHIVPIIGHRRVKDITPDDVKAVLLPISSKSASLNSKVLQTMKKIFESAADNGIISRSPCDKVKRGGVKAKEKYALTDKQRIALETATLNTAAYPFVLIGLYSGLRREEILGLQWDCVYLNGNAPYIEVRRAVRWENNQPVLEERLKSRAANRQIPIPPQLVTCLLNEKEKSTSSFVISNRAGGARTQTQFNNLWGIIEARTIQEELNEVTGKMDMQKLGSSPARHPSVVRLIDFPVTPHILRHTYITSLILANVDLKTVQYLAGHEDPQMTLRVYTHLMGNRPEHLIDKVKSAFAVKVEVKSGINPV